MVWKPDSYLRTPRWRQGTAVPEGAGHAPLAGGGWPTLLPWASAMAVLAAVYLPVLGAPFVWDDLGAIFFNSSLERPIPLTAYFGPEYFSLSGETTWRPLATLSYNALAVIAGKSPLAFRASGLALHLAAAALLARLLLGSGLSAGAAATAAALFLVHPAHVETLMCAAFNEELLAACGVLAMLLAHRAGMTLIAAAAFLAALASKETALAALPLVVLDDWSHHGPDRARRNLPRYAAYAAAAAAFEWWSIAGLAAPGFLARAAIPPWHRLYFAVESLWHGFRVQLIPTGLRIEYFALPPSSGLQVLAAAAFAAVFTGSAAAALKRFWKEPSSARPSNSLPEGGRDARPPTWTARPLAFYLAWPLLFWFAFSGLVPAGSLTTRLMAERWLYLPLLGSAALAAALLEGRPRVALTAMVVLGALGAARSREWADERRLWESLAAVYPWSAKAHEGLGEAYERRKDHVLALASFQQALRLREDRQDPVLSYYVPIASHHLSWESPTLRRSLGAACLRVGLEAAAQTHLRRAIDLAPGHPYPYRLLAYLYARQGRFPEARQWTAQGLSRNPGDDFLKRLDRDAALGRLTFHARFD